MQEIHKTIHNLSAVHSDYFYSVLFNSVIFSRFLFVCFKRTGSPTNVI